MDKPELTRSKVVLLGSAIVSLLLLMLAASEEHLSGAWRGYQKAYRTLLLERAATPAAQVAAGRVGINFQQIFLPHLKRVDRCTTCHIGIDDPGMKDAPQPVTTHSGDILERHPVERFGCTVCHDGQGRAVEQAAAHGAVEFWPAPLLHGEYVYTSCSRCHSDEDLFPADEDSVAAAVSQSPNHSVFSGALGRVLAADRAQRIARGRQLTLELGCLGCHKYHGRGGTLGPDVTYVGDKGTHDFDFTHVQGRHTPEQWNLEHFEDPARVAPGSLMPDVPPTTDEVRDLTFYMLSLHRKEMPEELTPRPGRVRPLPESGERLYVQFCSGCHGREGRGLPGAPPELKAPSLSNADMLAVASDAYLRSIVHHGRPDTIMIAWGDPRGGGLTADEIDRIVRYIRSWEPAPPSLETVLATQGDPRRGANLYVQHCASCHGTQGEGGIGTALRAKSVLSIASDEFVVRTLLDGRSNTAMPNWRILDAQQIADVIVHLRSWQEPEATWETTIALLRKRSQDVQHPDNAAPDPMDTGRTIYAKECAACHGASGEGGLGPLLNSQQYLAVAHDEYLFHTIVEGRPGTAMPSYPSLSSEAIAGLIAFLRGWQHVPPTEHVALAPYSGNPLVGKVVYERLCLECHGPNGEGASSTQLGNPVFARTVTDQMLYEIITNGISPSPALAGAAHRGSMPRFRGSEDDEFVYTESHLYDLIAYVRMLQSLPVAQRRSRVVTGDAESGARVYTEQCAKCHAASGEGAIGASLSNPEFLAAANDDFLLASILLGRENTEMLPVAPNSEGQNLLSLKDFHDLTAFMRSWQARPPFTGVPHRYLVVGYQDDPMVEMSVDNGRQLFSDRCAACHGAEGRGTRDLATLADCTSCHGADSARLQLAAAPSELAVHFGPQLNNREFLRAATDGFLQATIVRGRQGTAMPSFAHNNLALGSLDAESIKDIVIYIRSWGTAIQDPTTEGGAQPKEDRAAIAGLQSPADNRR
jgi:mono/diheme cytochrome c family protein